MRIRSIKPEFWRSDDIASLCWEDRLLFIGLWSYVDDNGVGRDNEKLILADLFPLEDDPRETLATVSRGLSNLFEAGLIVRYSVDGVDLLHISTWEKHQRIDKPNKPRHEPPTCTNAVLRDTLATPSRDSRETPAPGTGEQGNREQGNEGADSSSGDASAADAPTTALALVEEPPRADVIRLCVHLADRIEANGSNRPTIGKGWHDAARLMLDRDGRAEDEVHRAIDWCQDDEFWRGNVLSMPKLREKYEQLRLQAQRRAGTSRQQADEAMWDRAYARADAREGQ